jgi:hypothetical protein
MYNYDTIPLALLPAVIAQIVQFSQQNHFDTAYPDQVSNEVAFICACLVAQHTPLGYKGVETSSAYEALRLDKRFGYRGRLELAQKLVDSYCAPDPANDSRIPEGFRLTPVLGGWSVSFKGVVLTAEKHLPPLTYEEAVEYANIVASVV